MENNFIISIYQLHNIKEENYSNNMLYHSHNTIEFMYVYKGSLSISYFENDEEIHHIVNEDEFALVMPYVPHQITIEGKFVNCGIELSAKNNDNLYDVLKKYPEYNYLNKKINFEKNPVISFKDNQTIGKFMFDLYDLVNKKNPTIIEERILNLKINELLLLISKHLDEIDVKPKKYEVEKHAISYINSHYMQNISPLDVAKYCGKSYSYLRRKFQIAFNHSIKDEITQIRISKSQEFLKKTSLSVKEISHKVGFKTQKEYFVIFKKITGMTPSQYRQSISLHDSYIVQNLEKEYIEMLGINEIIEHK